MSKTKTAAKKTKKFLPKKLPVDSMILAAQLFYASK
jgi:hypothetical protein